MISAPNRPQPLSGNKMKYVFTLLAALLFVSGFAQEIRKIDGRQFQVHRVEKGHTLFAISKTYSISIDEILEHNSTARGGLSIGQEVLIPMDKVDKKAARSNPPEMKGKFLEHTVEKKETLYAISKKYAVEINSILEHNPEANAGINPGQVLKIYVGDVVAAAPEIVAPAISDSLVQHKVLPGETLYAIAKQYNVTVDSVVAINGGLPEGLKADTYIRIPQYTAEFKTEQQARMQEQMNAGMLTGSRVSYNVALMLPFVLNVQDSIFRKSDPTKNIELYTLTDIAVEIYRGVLIAVDSLRKSGFSVDLYVYDVAENLSDTRKILDKPEMQNMHLIIGPLHRKSYELVAEFAASKGVNIVSPVPNQMLKTRFKTSVTVHPNTEEQMRYLGQYMAKMHFTDRVIVVNSQRLKDADYLSTFMNAYHGYYKYGDSLKPVTMGKVGLENLVAKLSTTQKNYVVVPSSDLAFVSDFMNRLSNVKSSQYDITVVAMEKWLDYDNIDFSYKNRFKVLVPATAYTDFRKPQSVEFIRKYRDNFNTDPGQQGYGFIGFDVAWYFLSGLHKYGLDYPKHFSENPYEGLSLSFQFEQNPSGCRNKHIYLLQHKDYQLVNIN
jgi:LysM repeat protein/ABC-type branched-subunit amino acid transport system substrate-binding protein